MSVPKEAIIQTGKQTDETYQHGFFLWENLTTIYEFTLCYTTIVDDLWILMGQQQLALCVDQRKHWNLNLVIPSYCILKGKPCPTLILATQPVYGYRWTEHFVFANSLCEHLRVCEQCVVLRARAVTGSNLSCEQRALRKFSARRNLSFIKSKRFVPSNLADTVQPLIPAAYSHYVR